MKTLVLVVCLAAAAFARPDVSHLLHGSYIPPTTSYGTPAASVRVPSGSYLPTAPIGVFQAPGFGGVHSVSSVYQPGGVVSSDFGVSSVSGGLPASSGYYSQQTYASSVPQTVEHKKSYYFYAAPEEPATRSRIVVPIPPAQKRTNVIFIKTPVVPPQAVPVIVPQSGADQKTVVYVLVKKPEENVKPIVLPGASSPPSKPEVIFVKYKDVHDAHHVIQESLQTQGGPGAQDVGDNAFLQNIQASIESEKLAAGSAAADIQVSQVPGNVVEKVEGVSSSVNLGGGPSSLLVSGGSTGGSSLLVSSSSSGSPLVVSGSSSGSSSAGGGVVEVQSVGGSGGVSVSSTVDSSTYGPPGLSGPY